MSRGRSRGDARPLGLAVRVPFSSVPQQPRRRLTLLGRHLLLELVQGAYVELIVGRCDGPAVPDMGEDVIPLDTFSDRIKTRETGLSAHVPLQRSRAEPSGGLGVVAAHAAPVKVKAPQVGLGGHVP